MWEDVFWFCAGEMKTLTYKHTCAVILLTAHFSVKSAFEHMAETLPQLRGLYVLSPV